MAKFALECPKCGSINTASTFFLAKRVIKCGTCNNEIDVKSSRMTSKTCITCGKVIVCDQAKLDGKGCPFCGTSLKNSATAEYKMTDITCPQCYCTIEVDKTKAQTSCPICDKVIDVRAELAKKEQVNDAGVSVIKYEGDNNTFIWKHPIEDFNAGSQLIVHESQEAVFFLDGQALDTFGPGKHTLDTQNIPVLKKVYTLPTGEQNPFHAEIYFINKAVSMGMKWGTDSRVRFIEPQTKIPLDIGASGEMNLCVENGRKLLIKLVGTTAGLTRDQILSSTADADMQNTLRGFFRPLIMTAVKTNLAHAIKTMQINILEIDEHLEKLSEALRAKVSEGFEEYGLTVPQFFVTNVSLPESDPNFKKIRELMAVSYLGTREAQVEADIVAAKRQIAIEEQKTLTEKARLEAERIRIEAEAEADRLRMTGFAEAQVMAAQGYSQKDVLQADVQKEFAKGIGNMGSGDGSGGGNGMVSDVMGLGVGMAMANIMGNQVKDFSNGFTQQSNNNGWTCTCGATGNSGKFCSECGKPRTAEDTWVCTCGASATGKFCSECGAGKPEAWICTCGASVTGKFCSECGAGKPEAWDCPCGVRGITGKFCSECGTKREDVK